MSGWDWDDTNDMGCIGIVLIPFYWISKLFRR